MSGTLPTIKNGNLFVDRIEVSGSEFSPGQNIPIRVDVSNGAILIDTRNDTDACRHQDSPCETPGIHEPFGYCTRVRVTPDWTASVTERQCVKTALVGVGTEAYNFTLTAPDDPGEHDIAIELIADGSEQRGSTTRTITVTAPDGGDGGNGGGDGGGGVGIPREAMIIGGGIILGLGLVVLARRRRPAAPAVPQRVPEPRRRPPPREPTSPRARDNP